MQTLEMPRLTGSRQSARSLAEQLPEDLGYGEVTLDATSMNAASQSFADEIIAQVLHSRPGVSLRVVGATGRFARHLQVSAEVQGVEDRLSVDVRSESILL